MRRVYVPVLMAAVMVILSASNASAFGFLDKLCKSDCDACCDMEPACGCEAPSCGCEAAPSCGCDPCCDAPSCGPKFGLLKKLFHKHNHGCDSGCQIIEPACGCEIGPACGCEVAPSCGCDPCAKPSCGHKIKGLFSKLFQHHNHGCDCGCEIEPACGFEMASSCGCGAPACGCGH